MAEWIALTTTLLVEGLGMAVLAWSLRGWRPHWRRAVGLALLVNLISHTIFWYALPCFAPQPAAALPTAELLVVLLEGSAYAWTVARPRWTAWPVSFLLNWASWLLASYVW